MTEHYTQSFAGVEGREKLNKILGVQSINHAWQPLRERTEITDKTSLMFIIDQR